MVWLLPLVSSDVIVACLVPSPPCGVGPVCSTEIWYGCCRLLAVISSLRARYDAKYDVALFSLQTVPLSLRFSAPVKKHWLGSFSIVLPPSGLHGFVPVVRDRWEQGRPGGGRGPGAAPHGGGGVGARDPRAKKEQWVFVWASRP